MLDWLDASVFGFLMIFVNWYALAAIGVIVAVMVVIGLLGGWPFVLRELVDYKFWGLILVVVVVATLWHDQTVMKTDADARAHAAQIIDKAKGDGQIVNDSVGPQKEIRAKQHERIQHAIDTAPQGWAVDNAIDQIYREEHPDGASVVAPTPATPEPTSPILTAKPHPAKVVP